jgi:hypothetical protein
VFMGNMSRTAKHKLNGAYVMGAVLIAGLIGGVFGSWFIFFLALGVLVAVSVHDGSIRT